MKRHFLFITIFFILIITATGFSQKSDSFDKKYDLLLENLSNENWVNSEKIAKELLKYAEPIDSMDTQKKVLRYIYIYSTAGLLNENKLTQKEALKNVEFLKGKVLMMPSHPFNNNCYVNCTKLKEGEKNTFFTGVNNAKGTKIFSFEYVTVQRDIKESKDELQGKLITLTGELKDISVEGNILPRFRIIIINGDYKIEQ